MVGLYKYIFFKAYDFCIRVFKEKDFPWFFASGVISMTFVTTLIVLLELFEYVMLPTKVEIYGKYHGYFSLLMLLGTGFYMKQNNRYLKILEYCRNQTEQRQSLMRYLSVLYFISLFISFFLLGYLLRQYNLNS